MRVSFRSVFEGKDSPSARRSEYLHMGRVPSGNTYKRLSGHCRAKIEQYRESAASVAEKMSGRWTVSVRKIHEGGAGMRIFSGKYSYKIGII